MSPKLAGIFAPITTPFVNEDISLEHLKSKMRKYRQTELTEFFAPGSNGESKSLTEDKKLKVLDVILQEKIDRQLVMAGTGYKSTRQTIDFSQMDVAGYNGRKPRLPLLPLTREGQQSIKEAISKAGFIEV